MIATKDIVDEMERAISPELQELDDVVAGESDNEHDTEVQQVSC
jgi:hypothetical protein